MRDKRDVVFVQCDGAQRQKFRRCVDTLTNQVRVGDTDRLVSLHTTSVVFNCPGFGHLSAINTLHNGFQFLFVPAFELRFEGS